MPPASPEEDAPASAAALMGSRRGMLAQIAVVGVLVVSAVLHFGSSAGLNLRASRAAADWADVDPGDVRRVDRIPTDDDEPLAWGWDDDGNYYDDGWDDGWDDDDRLDWGDDAGAWGDDAGASGGDDDGWMGDDEYWADDYAGSAAGGDGDDDNYAAGEEDDPWGGGDDTLLDDFTGEEGWGGDDGLLWDDGLGGSGSA